MKDPKKSRSRREVVKNCFWDPIVAFVLPEVPMHLHLRTFYTLVLFGLLFAPVQSQAFGLGLTAELGGLTGFADPDPTSLELESPNGADSIYGGDLAVLLHMELLDKPFFKLHALIRAAGLAGVINSDLAASGFLGEVLGRATVDLPIVAPFIEIGGGAGQGQLHASDESAASAGPLAGLGAQAYLGAGLSLKVPFMPLFEIRAGNRLISAQGDWQTDYPEIVSLKEVHIGGGFRF